jgi:mannose-1-phosphate guanylyltransferase
MGRTIPKQYCAFVGTRSMLQHTLLRADRLGKREQQRTVIARAHQNEAQIQLADRWEESVIVQPANRETLAGIFLPLTHVYARDSMATVVIYPSDHFIYPQKNFVYMMERAIQATDELPHTIVLVGALSNSPETDYGWIYPGREVWRSGDYSVQEVRQFLEKPSRADAEEAMARGGVWNTLIIAAKAHTLWQLGWSYTPEILKHFERLYSVIGTSRERAVLESIYETMPVRNFSRDLLTPAASRIGVMCMKDVMWSDWGQKERIIETLGRIGKLPNFPLRLAADNTQVEQSVGDLSLAS